MIKARQLNLGSNDAENYKRKENKDFFNRIFVRDQNLEKLIAPETYFLIGEKGTGKTAYSVYLSNNEYKETRSNIRYIRETEYRRFIEFKSAKNLVLSDYVNIWKVLLLVLFAKDIESKELKEFRFSKNRKLKAIQKAIDEYYLNAFSPEINQLMSIVNETSLAAELFLKYLKLGGEAKGSVTFTESRFQVNLQYIQQKLENALSDIKIGKNHFIFIDGIDFRPDSVPYVEYLECVKGLANAVWQLNNDFFANIKDKKGRFKVVLLLRPDIFESISFQNASNKIFNNSVYLDWRTNYAGFKNSNLHRLGDRILSSQQKEEYSVGECWDHYFSWRSKSTSDSRDFDPAFIDVLKISLSRPRDLVTIMILLQKEMERREFDDDCFSHTVFKDSEFRNAYSEYLLSGIKDQLSFYYTSSDWGMFLRFFALFDSQVDFTYDFYFGNYLKYSEMILEESDELPEFVDSAETFLQFLYDTNIICYIENDDYGKPLFRWCYRERNSTNITPKVKTGLRYRFHYGLHKKLNIGKW